MSFGSITATLQTAERWGYVGDDLTRISTSNNGKIELLVVPSWWHAKRFFFRNASKPFWQREWESGKQANKLIYWLLWQAWLPTGSVDEEPLKQPLKFCPWHPGLTGFTVHLLEGLHCLFSFLSACEERKVPSFFVDLCEALWAFQWDAEEMADTKANASL